MKIEANTINYIASDIKHIAVNEAYKIKLQLFNRLEIAKKDSI